MDSQPDQKPNFRTEAIAGVTTFFTMAYIVIVNPSILSTEGTGMSFSGVLTATVLICFTMTLLMGLYAKLPFAVAPGMGINAFRVHDYFGPESALAGGAWDHLLGGRSLSAHLRDAHPRRDCPCDSAGIEDCDRRRDRNFP